MTKDERIARAVCPNSPDGVHWLVTPEDGEEGRYYGVCKWCGHVREYDANLGLGRTPKTVLHAGSHTYAFKREDV